MMSQKITKPIPDWDATHPLAIFAKMHLNASVEERDRLGAASKAEFRALWGQVVPTGILGISMPEAYGGQGGSVTDLALALEAMGYGCADAGLCLGVSASVLAVQHPILEFGTDAQKMTYLPDLISGKSVGVICLTEPQSGSDVMSMQTEARADGNDYIITGEKHYIGNSPIADMALVFAKTAPERGSWGVSVFLVDMRDPAILRDAAQDKMGLRTLPMGSVRFDGLRVPKSAMLGKPGVGAAIFRCALEWERGLVFSAVVGTMRRQLEDCVAFAKSREQFDQPVFEFQSVSNRLADMRLRLETARLIMLRSAQALEAKEDVTLVTSMAKLHISEAGLASVQDAMRIYGGQAYIRGHEIERSLRDLTAGVIYSGTSDIQRNLISQML